MVKTKNAAQKLSWALLLFASAIFFLGIKNADVQQKREALKIVSQSLADAIKFGSSLGLPKVTASLIIGNNKDKLAIDFKNKKITSARNFIYHYNGYTVKCHISFHGKVCAVTCETE